MKMKIYFIVLLILISGVAIIFNVSAKPQLPEGNTILDPTGSGAQDVGITNIEGLVGIISYVLTWTYTIFFVIAVLFVLFAAYSYLGGGEDAEKVKNAHKKIIWASVAIAVALLALSVNLIVQNFIIGASGGSGGGGGNNPDGASPSIDNTPCVNTADYQCPGSWD